jgi:hypothetical protein
VNNRQLAQVGLGLLGVWALLAAATAFIQFGAVVAVGGARLGVAEVIPVALMLGISYLLLFHNAKVTLAIFPDVDTTPDRATFDISRTLVALTGVMLLVGAMPSLINTGLNYFTAGAVDPTARGRLFARIVGLIVPIGAGLYLITRPERLLDYLDRPVADDVPVGE